MAFDMDAFVAETAAGGDSFNMDAFVSETAKESTAADFAANQKNAEAAFIASQADGKYTGKKKTPGWTDALRSVGRGLYGTAIGVGQLVNEVADKFTLNISPALKSNKEALRAAEVERRQWTKEHAAEFEGEGITNPIERMTFYGGMLAPGGATGKGAKVASTGLGRFLTGGLTGAGFGAAAPLVEGENRGLSTLIGAGAGAVLTPAIGAIAEYTPKITSKVVGGSIRKVKEGVDNYIERKVYPELAELSTGIKSSMQKELRKFAPPKLSDIQSTPARIKHWQNDMAAGDEIVKLRNEIELPDEAGNLVRGRLPQNLEQTVDATNQAMSKTGEWIDEITAASGGARIDLAQPISELRKVRIENGWSPERVSQAQRLIDEFEEIQRGGGYSFSAAIKRMAGLNNDAQAIFKGQNKSGDAPEILALAGNNLRATLNKAAEEVSPEFGELRRVWGQLSGLNQRSLSQFERTLAGKARGGINVFETLGAQQMLQSLATGRVDKLIQAGGSLATGMGMRMFKSPDRAARKFFELAATGNKGAVRTRPNITPAAAKTTMFDPTVGSEVPIQQPVDGVARTVQPDVQPAPYKPVSRTVQPDVRAQQYDVLSGGNIPAGPQSGIKTQGLPKQSEIVDVFKKAEAAKRTGNFKVLDKLADKYGFKDGEDLLRAIEAAAEARRAQ